MADDEAQSDEQTEQSSDTDQDQQQDEQAADEQESEDLEELESALEEGDGEDTTPDKPVVKEDQRYYGTGRRKEAIARVWVESGSGNIIVNDTDAEDYFMNRPRWVQTFESPIECVDFEGEIDVWATLEGGGQTGQADALQLGIARAIVSMDERARTWLRGDDHLTRDDRQLERKKINQPGARAKGQVSKR